MKAQTHDKSPRIKIQNLSATQVSQTVERSGLTRQEFASQVGCGTSQLYKYQQEGLPPRMNTLIRANILKMAMDSGVVAQNAAARAEVDKLAKGRRHDSQTGDD